MWADGQTYTHYEAWYADYNLFIKYYFPLHVSSLRCSSSGGYSSLHAAYGTVTLYESLWWPVGTQLTLCTDYHMLHVCNCILLKMSTWGSKHVEENSILWINDNQCIKPRNICIVKFMMHGQKNIKLLRSLLLLFQILRTLLVMCSNPVDFKPEIVQRNFVNSWTVYL